MKWTIGECVKSLADKKQKQATKCNFVAKQSKSKVAEVLFAMQATGCGTKMEQSENGCCRVMMCAGKWREGVG